MRIVCDEVFPKDNSQHALLMELPSYRLPDLKVWGLVYWIAPKSS